MTVECYSIDNFWKTFKSEWDSHLIDSKRSTRGPAPLMTVSEMMTIVILFHQSDYRIFKYFYMYVQQNLSRESPKLLSYERFVSQMKNLFIPLFSYPIHVKGKITGISFVDSTSIKGCHTKRISRNQVFKGLAKRGKTTVGWFYGFKLHLIINDMGEIVAFQLTPGNVSDVPILETLTTGLWGKLFGSSLCIKQKNLH